MNYYSLPSFSSILNINNIQVIKGESKIIISKSLSDFLFKIKEDIKNYKLWDLYKKYSNPYEFIHSSININTVNVSKLKPLSRSFYKLIEICVNLSLLDNYTNDMKTFHLAEGPGGFIEAIIFLRKNNYDIINAMTLIDDKNNLIPGWSNSYYYLNKHKNINIEIGIDKKGDLFNVKNLWYCYNKYESDIDLITADGGFDFSLDFNKQEINSNKLIFCQIAFAVAMQKKNGVFIIKFFDIFNESTIDLVYMLSLLYKHIYIIKPNTSRYANSEKYLICQYFKLDKNCIKNYIYKFEKIFSIINKNIEIKRFLNLNIPIIFKNKIDEINNIFGQQQLNNILLTFNLLNNKNDMENIKKNNIFKCIEWCKKYNIPVNNIYL